MFFLDFLGVGVVVVVVVVVVAVVEGYPVQGQPLSKGTLSL